MRELARQEFDFLYDEKEGSLYFNENGSTDSFGEGDIVAILEDALGLSKNNSELLYDFQVNSQTKLRRLNIKLT